MKRNIFIQNRSVNYLIKKSTRARRMRISIYPNALVVVTLPLKTKETLAEKFLKEKEDWLLKKILYFEKVKDNPVNRFNQKDYLKYKEEAERVIKNRVMFLNKEYGYLFKNIKIKNQKTIWGSCSKRGNLNFNYKILFLPEKIRDYIIIHELCHLKEMNHSSSFWKLVSKLCPDYRETRKDLYSYTMGL